MLAHRPGMTLAQAVIQALVIGIIKPLLLEGPFQVPVNLGHKAKARRLLAHPLDRARPEWQRLSTPRSLKYLGKSQHRHIAAQAVALAGDLLELRVHRFLGGGVAVIELQSIWPARKIWIPSMS